MNHSSHKSAAAPDSLAAAQGLAPASPSLATTPTLVQSPAEALSLARATCRELSALLLAENASLTKAASEQTEQRLQDKKRLTLRLEQLLAYIRRTRPDWQGQNVLANQANLLAEELQHFQSLAHRNSLLLQAAHRLRADLVLIIKDTLASQQPQAQLYGANGALAAPRPSGSLVMRQI